MSSRIPTASFSCRRYEPIQDELNAALEQCETFLAEVKTRFDALAKAIIEEDYGCMIAMINGETKRVPLAEVSGKLKTVDPDCQMIQEAKRIGISFGD